MLCCATWSNQRRPRWQRLVRRVVVTVVGCQDQRLQSLQCVGACLYRQLTHPHPKQPHPPNQKQGGAAGIGRAFCVTLLRRGYRVMILDVAGGGGGAAGGCAG